MSDRVIIGTVNDDADSSCFSGQFTPFLSEDPLPSIDGAFIAVSLEDIDKIFHRARYLSLDTDMEVAGGAVIKGIVTGEQLGGALKELVGFVRMDSEQDHATRDGAAGPCVACPLYDSTATLVSNIQFFVDNSHNTPVIYKLDDVFYVPIICVGSFSASDGGGNTATLSWNVNLANLESFVGPATGFVTATFLGFTFPIYYVASTSGTGICTFTNFDLTISEYWPYASLLGDPIYNTTTGAQLQSPNT